jgi:hypothetical protein
MMHQRKLRHKEIEIISSFPMEAHDLVWCTILHPAVLAIYQLPVTLAHDTAAFHCAHTISYLMATIPALQPNCGNSIFCRMHLVH